MSVKAMKAVPANVLALLQGGNFQPTEKVYAEKEVIINIPAGSWAHEEKIITPKDATKAAFKMQVALFTIGKEKFERAFRSGEIPNEDNGINISMFEAERDFTATNGTVVAKGTIKQFAVNE